MKKLLVLMPILLLLAACGAKPADPLPPVDPEETYYSVKLTPESSLITSEDTTTNYTVNLKAEEDETVLYSIEIGAPCYLSTKAHEFIMKPGSYLKSVSTEKVDRLIVDFWGGKGVNFGVYANADGTGDVLEYHESTVQAEDPNDGGIVYEYAINGSAWCLKNITEFNKPGIYSVTVVFSK